MSLWKKNLLFLFTRLNFFFFFVRDRKATEWSLQDLRYRVLVLPSRSSTFIHSFSRADLTVQGQALNSCGCHHEQTAMLHREVEAGTHIGRQTPAGFVQSCKHVKTKSFSTAGYSLFPTKLWTVANFPLFLLQEGVRNMILFLQGNCGHVDLLWPQQGSWGLKVMRRRGSHGKGVW